MSVEVMKQALDALELALSNHGVMLLSDPPQDAWKTRKVESKSQEAITALRAAIEQYDQTSLELCEECGWKAVIPGDGCLVCARQNAKPVAYADSRIHGWPDCFVMEPDPPHTVPLYTAPQQWVGLTDEEYQIIHSKNYNYEELALAVEAKLKEKNA
jgi:hypothetical protein